MKPHGRTPLKLSNIAGLALAAGATLCPAGTIRHDRNDTDYRNYAAQPQFASVGRYTTGTQNGSFTLIAPDWALTAAHVVDTNNDGSVTDEDLSNDRLFLGSLQRRPTQIFVPLGSNGSRGWNGSINNGFDIALVRLDQPVTTVTPASIYTSFNELGKIATAVGYGQTGTGLTGATGASGTKRAGDNRIDEFVTFSNGATALRWDFDEPAPRTSPNQDGSTTPLNLEYLIGPGDSGGGSFIFEDGAWWLAGVHSGTYDLFNYPNTTTDGSTYGDAALITRVSAYQDFIFSNIAAFAATTAAIPEPSSLAAGVLALLPTLRRRRSQEPVR